MADFLLNWVAHVRKLDQRLYLVGALDAKLAALCLQHGIPAATVSDETLASMGAGTLGASASKFYYRYAPGTFLRMGLIKQVFIRQVRHVRPNLRGALLRKSSPEDGGRWWTMVEEPCRTRR